MDKASKKTAVVVFIVFVAIVLIGAASYAAMEFLFRDSESVPIAETPETNLVQKTEPVTTSSDDLPDDLPSEVPLFEDAELIHTTTNTASNGFRDYSLNFHSERSSEDVFNFYKNALSSNGWQTQNVRSEDDFNVISASNDLKHLNVNFSGSSEGMAGTTYQLSVSVMTSP